MPLPSLPQFPISFVIDLTLYHKPQRTVHATIMTVLPDLYLHPYIFAPGNEVATSLVMAFDSTYPVAEALQTCVKFHAICPIPELTPEFSNAQQWVRKVIRFISMTSSAAVFLENPPTTPIGRTWTIFWTDILKTTAKQVVSPSGMTPREYLTAIALAITNNAVLRAERAVHEIGSFLVHPDEGPEDFLDRFEHALNEMVEMVEMVGDDERTAMEPFLKNIFLFNIRMKHPDLAAYCADMNLDDALIAFREWAESEPLTIEALEALDLSDAESEAQADHPTAPPISSEQ